MAKAGVVDYAAAAADLLTELGLVLRMARLSRGLDLRAAGEQIGVSHSCVRRVETSGTCTTETAIKILRWL